MGGWYGLLRNGDAWNNFDSLDVQSYVWAEALQPRVRNMAPCSPVRSVAVGISGGLLGGSFIPGLIKEGVVAAEGPYAILGAAVLGFVIFGGMTGALDVASQGCLDNK